MLTAELLRVRVNGKALAPSFLDPEDGRHVLRAEEVLDTFTAAAAARAPRRALDEALAAVEGTAADARLVRGLAKVCADACTFVVDAPVPPPDLRAAAFAAAAARGPLALHADDPAGRPTAAAVLADAAAALGWAESDPAALARALYADRKDALVLAAAALPDTPRALVHRYNLVLAQSVLLRALSLRLTVQGTGPKELRALFRALRFHQLLFRGTDDAGTLTLEIDGPASLLAASTRYGLQLATFFGVLPLLGGAWAVDAELAWGARNLRKQLRLAHTDGLQSHHRLQGTWVSSAESLLLERLAATGAGGWSVEPGAPLLTGAQGVLLPDLRFSREGRVAHVEILGHWRRADLRARAAAAPPNYLFAVSKRLLADKAGALPAAVAARTLVFAEVVPAAGLLALVEAHAAAEPT
jgi:predicted nuclease of restriction endonuclease-like RecB superfamily